MPDRKLVDICSKIAAEHDPVKMQELLEQLTVLLRSEQDAIRDKLRSRISAKDLFKAGS